MGEKMKIFKGMIVLCGFMVIFVTGCASIIKGGGSQAVNLRSEPAGAKCAVFDNVTGDNIANVITPNVINLDRGKGYFKYAKYNVSCAGDNVVAQNGTIEGYVNGWYMGGNLIFGGLIGYLIVDPATGAMWNLEPEVFMVNFNDPSKSILARVVTADNTAPTERK